MISIRRISLGGGYRYLTDSVAAGDGAAEQTNSLARYYAESGTPPGVFLGAGLADLDGGRGVETGLLVTEQHLENILAACADPITGQPVGTTPKAPGGSVPVAGFDLTFNPSKSVSVAWALADEGTKTIIYDCHRRAIEFVLSYAEREWSTSTNDVPGALFGAMTSLNKEGFSDCHVTADLYTAPDTKAQRVWIHCGEKSVLLITRFVGDHGYTSVLEQLGAMRSIPE